MLNNVLMGIQLVLAIFLMLSIMPQEGKGNFSSEFGEKKDSKHILNQRGNKHSF